MMRTWMNRNRKTSPTVEAEDPQEAPAVVPPAAEEPQGAPATAGSRHAQGSSSARSDLVNKDSATNLTINLKQPHAQGSSSSRDDLAEKDSAKKLIIKLKQPHAQGSSRDDLVNQDSAANVRTRSGREAAAFSQHAQGSSISWDDLVNQDSIAKVRTRSGRVATSFVLDPQGNIGSSSDSAADDEDYTGSPASEKRKAGRAGWRAWRKRKAGPSLDVYGWSRLAGE